MERVRLLGSEALPGEVARPWPPWRSPASRCRAVPPVSAVDPVVDRLAHPVVGLLGGAGCQPDDEVGPGLEHEAVAWDGGRRVDVQLAVPFGPDVHEDVERGADPVRVDAEWAHRRREVLETA